MYGYLLVYLRRVPAVADRMRDLPGQHLKPLQSALGIERGATAACVSLRPCARFCSE
jgi:hypothetical protein